MAKKTVLMCPPTYFEVAYEINDWMHVDNPVDVPLAKLQWQTLHDTYLRHGYDVKLMEPVKGLPDIVFTANGGLVIDGKVCLPKFRYPERQPESAEDEKWFRSNGYEEVYSPKHFNEGEGDNLFSHDVIFGGYGFRTAEESHQEMAEFFNKEVVSLHLVDPRFYHLDTCFCPLNDTTVMYYPGAFSEEGRFQIEKHFPNRIVANEEDATGFGLNGVSDGENVFCSAAANGLIEDLKKHRFNPVPMDMTEFRKAGGAVKCCTLELRS